MEKTRNCLECGDHLFGRRDKKFCTGYCRSTFNNRIYREINSHIRSINSILRKNRLILFQLRNNGKTRIKRHKLYHLGFDFEYVTYVIFSEDNTYQKYCYEQGYVELEGDEVELVVNENIEEYLRNEKNELF